MNSERELFEEWCVKDDEFSIHRYAGADDYSDDYTQSAWLAWQASAQRQGYKLVPVEPTEEMYLTGYDCKVQNGSIIDIYKAMIGACDD